MKQPTREDYELAARASGIRHIEYTNDYDGSHGLQQCDEHGRHTHSWNPLSNDGDSRRLQVACGIDLILHDPSQEAVAQLRQGEENTWLENSAYYKDHNNDKCEAARHAVFKLAVEIGRAMQ
jgi:hypothetical protein